MKSITLILFIFLFIGFFSCTEKGEEPTPLDLSTLVPDQTKDDNEPDISLMGTFKGSAHPTSGTASIEGVNLKLHNDFNSDNGPDLYIYLAQDLEGNGFVDLGTLQSTSGEQTYNIPEGVDYSKNKYVLVWCKEYSVLFGYAEVE